MRAGTGLKNIALTIVALWSLVAGPAWAAPQKAEDFFRRPAFDQARISPSGEHVAMRVTAGNGRRHLAVMRLAPPWNTQVIAGFADADVDAIRWVNDERLVFRTSNRDLELGDQQQLPGLYAVGRDGSSQRQLISHGEFVARASSIVSRVLPWNWFLHSTLNDGSADVIVGERVYTNTGQPKAVTLARLNTLTGEKRSISDGHPEGARSWVLDHQGRPRVVTATVGPRRIVHWRAGDDAPWQQIASFDRFNGEGFSPSFIDADGNLLVSAAGKGSDTVALYRYDVGSRKLDEQPLIRLKDFDLDADFEIDPGTGKMLGVHYRADGPGSYWFDKALSAAQAGIDRALPGRANRLHCGDCHASPVLLIESRSDTQPGEFYLFDRKAGSLQRLVVTLPSVDPKAQAARSFHRVAARDGLALPLFITKPAGASGQPLPTVVLVHGGPWVRGHDILWDAQAQFLASRGYLVLQVEFRGSDGYGWRHWQAGFKQWGLAMQDDLADALGWAVTQKLADPKRVCIAGGSYGGYAALMGPIRHPGTYRCAISWMGVTDLDLMYTNTWSDLSDDYKQFGMPTMIGDRVADAAQLAATSPLKNAERFNVPVLLAGGALDRRVPIEHAKRFRDAAQKAGAAVEWVEYPGEGHGWAKEANEVDFWRRVDAFLVKHIGADAAPKQQ
jgi:dipeptidyl aminopeptidase/acylaminoacyl peptidase